MSAILRPDFPKPPHRIPISGASPSDIALVAESVDLIFNMAMSALMGRIGNLRENLPGDAAKVLICDDLFNHMRDIRSEMLGRLEQASEKLE
jgi:hypothetical protein